MPTDNNVIQCQDRLKVRQRKMNPAYQAIKFGRSCLSRGDGLDLFFTLHNAPQGPKDASGWRPESDLLVQLFDLVLCNTCGIRDDLSIGLVVNVYGEIGSVKPIAFLMCWIRAMVLKRVRQGWVVIIRPPFIEMVGNVVAARIGSCILEINDNQLVVFGSTQRKRLVQL